MTLLETREELRELAFRYAQAVDGCDADGLLTLFTPNGSVGGMDATVPAFQGPDDLRLMIAQVKASFVKTMHNVFNQTFEIEPDTAIATGETYCVASHVMDDMNGGWNLLDMAIRYHNDYTRTAGGWKFARRRLQVEWVETRPVEKFSPEMLSKDPDKIV